MRGLNELVESKDRQGGDEDGSEGDADDEGGVGEEEEEDEDEEADEVELLGEFLLEGEVRFRLCASEERKGFKVGGAQRKPAQICRLSFWSPVAKYSKHIVHQSCSAMSVKPIRALTWLFNNNTPPMLFLFLSEDNSFL